MRLLRTPSGRRDHVRIGIVGTVVLVLLIQVTTGFGFLWRLATSDVYLAEFSEIGNLVFGDEVRLAGFTVGAVQSITLDEDRVVIGFTVRRGGTLGDRTRVAIKGASPLGKKYLAVLPAGTGELDGGDRIPLERSTPPFDVSQALAQLTSTAGRLDGPRIAQALRAVSDTLEGTPDELRATIDGLSRLSRTIAERDDALQDLLARAANVTGVLADRRQQLERVLADGNRLLGELVARRDAIRGVLAGTTPLLEQVEGLVRDNDRTLGPALDELRRVNAVLIRNEKNISAATTGLATYAGGVGEAAGNGPWIQAYVPNAVPDQPLPPLGDLLAGLRAGAPR